MIENEEGRWITAHGHHVFLKDDKKTIQAEQGKRKLGKTPQSSPVLQKSKTSPISKQEIKKLSQNLPEARELKDALKEKYTADELRAEMSQMHENSIRKYGEASGKYGEFHFNDITEDVIAKAKPGEGRLFTEFTDKEESNPEKAGELEDAKMIAKYLGGDVVHLKERSDIFRIDSIKTADYFLDGYLTDRKKSTGGGAMTHRVRKGAQQIMTPTYVKYDGKLVEGKPGGILIAVMPSSNGTFRNNREICKRISMGLSEYKESVPYPLRIMIKRGPDDLMITEVTKE